MATSADTLSTHTHISNVADILDPAGEMGISNPSAVEIIGVTFMRMYHLAMDGDNVLVPGQFDETFADYMQHVFGFSPNMIRTPLSTPHRTADLTRAMDNHSEEALGKLNPYLQSPAMARYAQERGLQMAYTEADKVPALMYLLDDKRYFRQFCVDAGHPMLPQMDFGITDPNNDMNAINGIEETIQEYGGAFIQHNRSGGGEGNCDMKYDQATQTWRSARLAEQGENYAIFSSWEDAQVGIRQFIREGRDAGTDFLLVTPYMEEIIETPTVNGYIPNDGSTPVIYGRFDQVIQPGSNAYLGFEYMPNSNGSHAMLTEEIYARTMDWFLHIQALDYTGNADVDHARGRIGKQIFETESESNMRMDAMRFALQHAAMVMGLKDMRSLSDMNTNNLPAIRAIDHMHTHAGSTEQLIASMTAAGIPLLGHNGKSGYSKDGGVLIMTPPNNEVFAAAAVGQDINEVRDWMSKLEEVAI